jgi:hypothetical protein
MALPSAGFPILEAASAGGASTDLWVRTADEDVQEAVPTATPKRTNTPAAVFLDTMATPVGRENSGK